MTHSLVDLEEANLAYILPLLTRHQLSIFAGQNCDVDFFRCLVQRLNSIVRSTDATEEHVPAVELFKLLILERKVDVEAALGVSYYHGQSYDIHRRIWLTRCGCCVDSEARLIDRLINSVRRPSTFR